MLKSMDLLLDDVQHLLSGNIRPRDQIRVEIHGLVFK
jgi:hypothetical protein